MQCPVCGQQNRDGALYCYSCGGPLVIENQAPSEASPRHITSQDPGPGGSGWQSDDTTYKPSPIFEPQASSRLVSKRRLSRRTAFFCLALAGVLVIVAGSLSLYLFTARSQPSPPARATTHRTVSSTPTRKAPTATPTATATPTPTATTSSVIPTVASGTSGSSAVIATSTATVNGTSETILTDAQGKTLYYFTADTATTSACTSTCGQTWPALLATGSGTPTSATTLPGTLTMQTTGNGNQIAYNGHLLYTYSGDTAPGQTSGEGIAGKWFVAIPTLAS